MAAAAGILAGGSVLGGLFGKSGAKSAANEQAKANAQAIAEQQREFDTLLSLSAPQRAIGNQALASLGRIYGYDVPSQDTTGSSGNQFIQVPLNVGNGILGHVINGNTIQVPNPNYRPGTPAQASGQVAPANYEDFFASPDYRFRLNQGTQAVQNSAAAQGGLYSGNALRALNDYAQGTASNEFSNWFNRQAALAGIGQAATSQAGNAALQTGANVGNLLVNQGNARASGIIGQTNSISNMVNQLGLLLGSGAFSNSFTPSSGWSSGANLNQAWAGQWGGVPELNLG